MCVCRGGLLLLMVFANKDLRSHSISGASRLMSNEINTRQLCPVIVASMKGLRILFFLLKFKFYLSVSSPREAVNPYEPLLTFSLPESRDFDASILAGKQAPTKKKKTRVEKLCCTGISNGGGEGSLLFKPSLSMSEGCNFSYASKTKQAI